MQMLDGLPVAVPEIVRASPLATVVPLAAAVTNPDRRLMEAVAYLASERSAFDAFVETAYIV